MALKSYSSFKLKKRKKKRLKRITEPLSNGINALVGVALLSETAEAVAKI